MDEIFLVNSSSFQDFEISTSLRMGPGSIVDLTQASTITGSGAGFTDVSASYIMPDTNTTASWAVSSSWAPQQQDISVNTLTASVISASLSVTVPSPIQSSDAVTKEYVDNLSQQGLDFYFRSASADFEDYYQMRRLSVPLSSSISTFVVSNVSASQYFVKFLSGELNTNQIAQGRVNVRYHMWYNAGGSRTITVAPELYLSSSSGESELAIASDTLLNGETTAQYLATITLTSSIAVVPTDRLVCKFKAVSVASSPINVSYEVEGDTSAGINVPIPSANFVLRAGDTMTGPLTASIYGDVTGTASFATSASWAPMPLVSDSSSWASSSLSASRLNPGSMLWTVSGSNGIAPAFLAPYDYSVDNVYRPTPIREGWTHWDHKWNDWAVYDDSGARTHLGREIVIAVHNPTATVLPRLAPVYISGSSPALQTTWSTYKPDVYLAQADGTGTKARVVGVVRQNIPSGSDGYILCAGTMHNSNMIPFGDVGTELWLSPSVAGGLTTTKPGQPSEVVSVGYVIEAGGTGSLLVALETEPPPSNAYAGMTAPVTITDDTASLQIYIDSSSVNLYSNSEGIGRITGYPVPSITMSLASSSYASYVYAETDGSTASYQLTTDFSSINGTSKAFVATVYRADIDTHALITNEEGLALANKINNRFLATEKFGYESGFTLSETGSRNIFITSGKVWFGATQLIENDFDSRISESVAVPYHEVHWAIHSASVWTIPVLADGQYPNGYYDNGVDATPLAPNSYSLHYVFRILGDNPTDEDAFIITSNYQYPDVASSQNDTIPTGIPTVITDVGLLVGRIIFQSGSSQASLVESAFTTNFGQSLVTQHNGLGGLQGGQGGEYYHLTAVEYAGTGVGVFVRANDSTITATGSLDGTASYSNRTSLADTTSFATYAAATNTAITVSYANFALSASWAPATEAVASSSWASSSFSSSYAVKSSTTDSSSYSARAITSSFGISAANADTASYSTYASSTDTAITTSWSNNSTSASFASRTISSSFAISAANADTSSYSSYASTTNTSITTSWANQATSASFASRAITSSYALSSTDAGTASFATYAAATNTNITVSYADFALSASWAPGGQQGNAESSSWASSSFTSSYAVHSSTADSATTVASASWADTASWAINAINGGTQLVTASTYPITSSWSVSSSWAPATIAVDSASWASSSLSSSYAENSSTADSSTSASFASRTITSSFAISSSNADFATSATSASFASRTITSSYALAASSADSSTSASFASRTITSSYALESSNADSSSYATKAGSSDSSTSSSFASRAITSSYAIAASSADTAVSASYASSAEVSGLTFSKGVTFYDPSGIAGTASLSQSIVIWRAPFAATASNVWVWKEGGNQSLGTASVNVRKNETLNLITSSFQVTQSQAWVGATSLQNQNFSVGDTMDVILITASFFPQNVAVQIDLIRQ